MIQGSIAESVVEQARPCIAASIGYVIKHGVEIAPGEMYTEQTGLRTGYT